MSYTVDLQTFHGPLDLLIYLVKRNEVDILDIPIATIAEQFHLYLLAMQTLDIELAGDFIDMAATLMLIKSRMLLPPSSDMEEDEQDDPRRELVKQLLEYRKFKDAAAALETLAEQQVTRIPHYEPPDPSPESAPRVKSVELWDLVSAFARLMRETQAFQPATISVDDTPQHVYEAQLMDRIAAAGRIRFLAAFTPPYQKARLIGIFLAILELIRNHGLGLDQPEPEGEIWLVADPNCDRVNPDNHEPDLNLPTEVRSTP